MANAFHQEILVPKKVMQHLNLLVKMLLIHLKSILVANSNTMQHCRMYKAGEVINKIVLVIKHPKKVTLI